MKTEWSVPVPTESEPEIVDPDGSERCPRVLARPTRMLPGPVLRGGLWRPPGLCLTSVLSGLSTGHPGGTG